MCKKDLARWIGTRGVLCDGMEQNMKTVNKGSGACWNFTKVMKPSTILHANETLGYEVGKCY
jgi:hypothetical protein